MPNDAAVLPREHLIRALEADLVGPFQPDADGGVAEEILPIPPSGFLAPQEGRDLRTPLPRKASAPASTTRVRRAPVRTPSPSRTCCRPATGDTERDTVELIFFPSGAAPPRGGRA